MLINQKVVWLQISMNLEVRRIMGSATQKSTYPSLWSELTLRIISHIYLRASDSSNRPNWLKRWYKSPPGQYSWTKGAELELNSTIAR